MIDSLANKTIWSTLWSLADVVLTKGIAFAIGLVLARLLSPSDFGLIGMMTVFIALCDTFIESGLSNALIRKIDRNQADCSTAFLCNLMFSIVCYIVLFFCADYIADFYNEVALSTLIKVLGLNVILYALYIVPNALIIASFSTKVLARINMVANLTAGIIAIFLAYRGIGVWALVVQSLLANGLKCVGFWISVKWKPAITFSRESATYLWKYGSKSIAIGVLGTFFNNIYNLLIGKYFAKQDLGYFTRAQQFVQLPISVIESTFMKVSVATFAVLQEDNEHLKEVYRKYVHVIAFIVFPLCFLLFAIAKPLILFLLTDKWENSIIMLQILSLGAAFSPLGIINICLLQAINKLDYSLKLEIAKKSVYTIIILITFHLGLLPMVIGVALYNVIGTAMNCSCGKKFLNYRYTEQIMDIGRYIFASLISGFLVFLLLDYTEMSNLLQLFTGVFLFVISYILITFMLRYKAWDYSVEILRKVHA